jgi:site-specific recombinase XerD
MAKGIQSVKSRESLKVRREPHWQQIRRGCHLGFRKMTATGDGVWVARYRDPDTLVRSTHSLGSFEHLTPSHRHGEAQKAAEEWFTHMGAGGVSKPQSVSEACRTYVEHLTESERSKTAVDADGRFKRWVYPDPIGKLELQELTHPKVADWRKRLSKVNGLLQGRKGKEEAAKAAGEPVPEGGKRSLASLNRDMAALKAALNFALLERMVTNDAAWRVALKPEKNANGRRLAYLDGEQRRALLAAASEEFRPFLRGLTSLPLRPGTLAARTVGDFDKRLRVLTIGRDKTGRARSIQLPPVTAALLVEQAKGKLPAAPLFSRTNGSAWSKDSWKGPMKAAVVAAGLPEVVTAYTLRHSTITDLITVHKLDLLTVGILSDTSVTMIEKHYGHLGSERAADALSKLAL